MLIEEVAKRELEKGRSRGINGKISQTHGRLRRLAKADSMSWTTAHYSIESARGALLLPTATASWSVHLWTGQSSGEEGSDSPTT